MCSLRPFFEAFVCLYEELSNRADAIALDELGRKQNLSVGKLVFPLDTLYNHVGQAFTDGPRVHKNATGLYIQQITIGNFPVTTNGELIRNADFVFAAVAQNADG